MKRKLFAVLLSLLSVSLLLIYQHSAFAEEQEGSFSFVVFGDNRLPGYLPYKSGQTDEIEKYFEQIKRYAYGPDLAVEKIMSFDPDTGELDWFKYWPKGLPDKYRLTVLKNGWPRLIVEGPQADVSLRSEGQAWVYRDIIAGMKEGAEDSGNGPSFCLNTGDMTYFGYQGKTRDTSPFWHDFHERFLSKLPSGNPEGLPGRFFPAPGNHETWFDENLEGLLSTVPYLTQMGFTSEQRVYKFDYRGCRFIFLDTGDMDYRTPAAWGSRHPDFQKQMAILTEWLNEAKDKKLHQVFITFHNPAFCQSGFGPLPPNENPHPFIKPFGADLSITVFNGHVHTTELYLVDNIRYLVLGAGGGEQRHGVNQPPKDYPEELYWEGQPRVEDYNYLVVQVSGKEIRFRLHRYRPNDENPFAVVELYKLGTIQKH